MSDFETLTLGAAGRQRAIAVLRRDGATPGLFWLGGFRSDMTGTKAEAVDAYAARHGLAVTRFDYSGHGRSGGRFEDAVLSDWLEEALAVFATTTGPQIVIGSSMGGWLSLLLALRPEAAARVAALVLIAPAPDFTERLMLPSLPAKLRATLERDGRVEVVEPGMAPYPLTRALIEDGRRHLLLDGPIALSCPVTILQGGADTTVPVAHALMLTERLTGADVTLSVIRDGDHRLSRPEDIERLLATLDDVRGNAVE
jgi:pimeloyl-ACP methyl ester carboxylesterase